MSHSTLLFACLLPALLALPGWAQEHPGITVLGQQADVVAVAKLEGIIEAGGRVTPNITIQLNVIRYLKGQSPSLNLVATIPAHAMRNPGPATMPAAAIGATGIWFLKSDAGSYQILPRDRISYHALDLYLPLADISAPPGASTLDDQLLAYAVRWYLSLSAPNMLDDDAFLGSMEPQGGHMLTSQQVLSAVAPLLQSPIISRQLTGLIAALRMGSIPAMQTVMANMQTLSTNVRFFDVIMSIAMYPRDPAWIPVLRQLAEMHTTVKGIDGAGVGALARIGTRDILPVMAEFLDSKDPAAQMAASSWFAKFAMLGTAQGVIPDSAPFGPFWTAQAKAFTPGPRPSLPADQYVSFWKSWWSQNAATLGFTAP